MRRKATTRARERIQRISWTLKPPEEGAAVKTPTNFKENQDSMSGNADPSLIGANLDPV
jgi:hypothetical protein